MDEKAIQAIVAILKRGNDAVIRRKGSGVVVLEEKKEIKYQTPKVVFSDDKYRAVLVADGK